ncbi:MULTISPECIES: preprotein translocase subunit SecE [Methylocaldum]|jgi:preprotein translocase subunit SecE|uniref:preprotein translocase subunit SecE n=1 Tax=unclassified Methylocaldum TaxID=2622260 RepID=UPI00098A67AA|nr:MULTISPECIES: preprotein translocase subunit SecE [unclassified Methylocaldum]MBP1152889.1 preprotein translocase subunit SecE [Methylocaldum sp. RMAD-M]MDV3240464.1 preprotein translocase subunit SecE [Methylocaldum sp.]MVF24133.1 preprotein translocase subunit SecE [Methylocaldum sp. BRCS4]
MAARAESGSSVIDTAKLVLAIGLLIAGVVGFYYFSQQSLLYRVLGVVGLSIASVAMILTTSLGKSFWGFLKEARVEVRKVVWPTRQETVQATLIVMALVFLVGLMLWLLDMFLFWVISQLTGQGA